MTENLFENFDNYVAHEIFTSFNIEIKPKSVLPLFIKEAND